ncbi:ATP-dependent DNA ligase LigD phosphoesterase module /ATP-dependent DNA ligase LigD polymerase module [Loktanella fryxellensis]|uniref:DNA ligase (ATP) n=1 Tax=Loktanella fryxellensis TaxID=245187 RepID=A0A1H8K0V3_9RHOB|nr:DNA ligase D [Loktanella fryxellensis]SEN86421.1 ATP-dependent DNA ligase LigD phosphoesterase module /ATP-dependent DNA ligase LigD polymerase module [Loktanella fryxellensis]
MDRLARYRRMRDFGRTPEPQGSSDAPTGGLRFAVQKHAATRLHWDLRLEWDGVLLSWAVTRGPSRDPGQKRLAVRTEDHPRDYLDFEGVIPEGYGAGAVMLWDIGWWMPLTDMEAGLATGTLKLRILSHRMSGAWTLVRMKGRRKGDAGRQNWLLIKERDSAVGGADDLTDTGLTSVATGRTLDAIAAGATTVARQAGRRPAFHAPQLATLRDAPPTGDVWRIEPKHDGYRAMVALGKGGPRILTRNGHDWTDRFAALTPYMAALPCKSALIDGEVVAGLGLESFGALQTALSQGGPLAFYAFDLLHLDGKDLTPAPFDDRRAALERLLADQPAMAPVRLSPYLRTDGQTVLDAICAVGGEGIVAKRGDAPYRGRRTTGWLKVKCGTLAEFIVAGYAPSDVAGRPFASLVMATRDDGKLTYRGRVGTGFDDAAMDRLARAMAPLQRDRCPFATLPRDEGRNTVWLTPTLVAEVRHAGLTDAGRIRHGAFLGLRDDKPARTVTLDRATGPSEDVAGVRISNPRRMIFPDDRVSKLGLARYYNDVAPAMLATAADRPLSLLRYPAGIADDGFFQRHAGDGFPDAVRRMPVPTADGGTDTGLWVGDAAGLVGCVQMGTIEFHLWGAHRDRIDRPDRMVFDLDPDPAVGFNAVCSAAIDIRDRLADLGLVSHAVVTGGKGVHVVVNLRRTASWETVKGFARVFATLMAARQPNRFTASMAKARRTNRIFIDWLRNERGATAIAPFSVRARPGARVAVLVAWDELPNLHSADFCTLDAARERAATAAITTPAVTLGQAVVTRLDRWSGQAG